MSAARGCSGVVLVTPIRHHDNGVTAGDAFQRLKRRPQGVVQRRATERGVFVDGLERPGSIQRERMCQLGLIRKRHERSVEVGMT